MPESKIGLPGWEDLVHGGLLLDGARQAAVAQNPPEPLSDWVENQLRRQAGRVLNGVGNASSFTAFVLEEVCGLDAATGAWARGSDVASAWGRRAITGETVKPRQLWQGPRNALLPVFLDDGKALGIGRSRRVISQVLGWLRNGGEHLALVTNGRHWRLLFAGLDYDAWCQWDLDLWFQEGELSPQVTALRILLHPAQWTPPSEGDAPPLLQAIRDTRKGQAELSEVLGERVREAVEILIQGHGEALAALVQGAPQQDRATVAPADIYHAACRVAMRLVVILFAESRDLLPRDNALYHSAYGLQGLLEQLQAAHNQGVPLTERHSAWPRVLALFRLVWQGAHFPELPVKDYGGELFAPAHAGRVHDHAEGSGPPERGPIDADHWATPPDPGPMASGHLNKNHHAPDSAHAKIPLDEMASELPDEDDGLSQALAVFENACFKGAALPDSDVLKMLQLLTRTTVLVRQGRRNIRVAAPVDFSDLSSEYIGILYEGLLDYELKTAPADDPVIFLAMGDRPALPLSRLEAMNDRAIKALFQNLKDSSATEEEDATDEDEPFQEPPSQNFSPNADLWQPAAEAALATTEDAQAAAIAKDPLAPDAGALAAPVKYPRTEASSKTPLASTAGGNAQAAAVGEGTRLEARYARPEYQVDAPDQRQLSRSRAEAWARGAAQTAGLVKKPRGKITPERRLAADQQLQAKARQLIARVVLPGEWHLVRWGGTRKGSGTFYTRPGLAVPTVQRTLRPLAYDPPGKADGTPNPDAPHAQWRPKRPEQILALKLCDPACGCGTFPLAALRFLTDALYEALQHHGRIEQDGERSLVRLLGIEHVQEAAPWSGERTSDELPSDANRIQLESQTLDPGEPLGDESVHASASDRSHPARATFGERLGDELIPCRPDDDRFEPRLKAVLRRHVVERCLYAVDLNPLAVELCRLSLWIETMDRTLPFSFLNHKIKCGNALVGAWFDQFAHYPAMAWKNREGGDKNHGNGAHFAKDARGKALKAFVKERLTPDLALFLRGADLFQEDLLTAAATAHNEALAVLTAMHDLPVQDAKARAAKYRDEFLASPAWRKLKGAMDLWCACWFWPPNELDCAPLPRTFANPPDATRAVAERLARELRFFHWELEFPDVFNASGAGFDAILGNPPWDIAKPVSKEFFSNIDPLYRSYGKQEAVGKQTEYFRSEGADGAGKQWEESWLDYNARFRAQSNFASHAASPFGDPEENAASQSRFTLARGHENRRLHDNWRRERARGRRGFADPAHPFRHQGAADLNLYKLFLEAAHALLRTGGRLGFVVPSGLYSDNGTRALRHLFLEHCQWEWLFGIENKDGVFPIHRSYKFNPVIVQKGGATEAIRTAFMRRNLADWERAEAFATPYTRAQVARFSPKSRAILEIQSARDLEILEKIYAGSVLLGDDGPNGWGIRYAREFDMTNDSKLFPPRPQWEAKGYRPDEYSRWLLGDWRPIGELWAELGVDPARPVPAKVALEDWLFNASAGPERRMAEARFAHGHLLKPGDVARTEWPVRCAQPPYNALPVPRAVLPAGVVLSREGDAWIREDRVRDVALPVYVGKMIYVGNWAAVPVAHDGVDGAAGRLDLAPEFLLDAGDLRHTPYAGARVVFRDIARTTDQRSFISALLPGWYPCGNKTPILGSRSDVSARLELSAMLTSLAFDWGVRQRMSGTTLNWHIVESLALPPPKSAPWAPLTRHYARLALSDIHFAPDWLRFASTQTTQTVARTLHERLRVAAMIDAAVAAIMGLSKADLRHILTECDHPNDVAPRQPKGFWRMDKGKPPELRQTVLTLLAFDSLLSQGEDDAHRSMTSYLTQQGDGWQIPETIRLADYGLGHDDRAKQHQPVASHLGPRFYDWQLAQPTDEAMRERHLHARNLLGALDYTRLLRELESQKRPHPEETLLQAAEDRAKYEIGQPDHDQKNIFE